MCNIAGAIKAANKKTHDSFRLKVLHTFGRTRGTDSSGICYNNDIKYWVKTKHYNCDNGDALYVWYSNEFPENIKSPIVLLHNRSASIGAITEKEAHPYEIDDNFIGIMNGTIYNYKELADKYNIDHNSYHTDSELLFQIIYRHGTKVLKEYIGGCAFAFYLKEDPTKLYIWKGASKNYTKVEEERPLYYTIFNGVLYFNSLATGLHYITNGDSEIIEVPTNTLMCFHNTNLISSETIDRSEMSQAKPYTSGNYYNSYQSGYLKNGVNVYQKNVEKEIKEKSPLSKISGNRVYYYDGKYRRNGHVLNGEFYVNMHNGDIEYSFKEGYQKLYFYNGYWISNKIDYDKLVSGESKFVYINVAHKDSLIRTNDEIENYHKYWYNNTTANGWILPKFGYNSYKFENGKLTDCVELSKNDDDLLLVFNKLMYKDRIGIYCENRNEANTVLYSICGKNVDWTDSESVKRSTSVIENDDVETYEDFTQLTYWT